MCSEASSEISKQIGELVGTSEGVAHIVLIAPRNQSGGVNSSHGPAAGAEKNREASSGKWSPPHERTMLGDSPKISRSFAFASRSRRLAFRSSPLVVIAPGWVNSSALSSKSWLASRRAFAHQATQGPGYS